MVRDNSLLMAGFLWMYLGCSASNRAADPSQSIVDGIWLSECLENQEVSQVEFSFASIISWEQKAFEGQSCEESTFDIVYQGSYELIVTQEQDVFQLDVRIQNTGVVPRSEIWVAEARKNRYCGFDGWENGQLISFDQVDSAETCPSYRGTQFIHYNTIKIDDGFAVFAGIIEPENERPLIGSASNLLLTKID
ncbi:MAG: hypothetical protein HRU19_05215 [Pseudobacteriovorax sp.]|nr:hypothetical protein [Pseudobacteriovorax sp.]